MTIQTVTTSLDLQLALQTQQTDDATRRLLEQALTVIQQLGQENLALKAAFLRIEHQQAEKERIREAELRGRRAEISRLEERLGKNGRGIVNPLKKRWEEITSEFSTQIHNCSAFGEHVRCYYTQLLRQAYNEAEELFKKIDPPFFYDQGHPRRESKAYLVLLESSVKKMEDLILQIEEKINRVKTVIKEVPSAIEAPF